RSRSISAAICAGAFLDAVRAMLSSASVTPAKADATTTAGYASDGDAGASFDTGAIKEIAARIAPALARAAPPNLWIVSALLQPNRPARVWPGTSIMRGLPRARVMLPCYNAQSGRRLRDRARA